MKWKPKFLSQSGFTLVEVLIAAAALGGLALVATQLTSDVDKTKKHFEVSTEITQIKSTIGSTLGSTIACGATFVGLTPPLDLTSINTAPAANRATTSSNIYNIPSIKNSAGTVLYTDNIALYNNRITPRFAIIEKQLAVSGSGKVGFMTLRIHFRKNVSAGIKDVIGAVKGGEDAYEFITIRVTTDMNDVVQDCFNDQLSIEESWCDFSGGTYDAPTETCTFKAYPGTSTPALGLNFLDTSVPSGRIIVSERYLAQLLDDLDRRYVNANTGGGGAVETLADTTNTLTIGDNAGSGGDTIILNALVGIGATPQGSLHVTGPNVGASTIAGASLGTSGSYSSVELKGTSGGFVDFGTVSSDFSGRIMYDQAASFMSFSVGALERVRIDSVGNMGIGTTTPLGYRLNVNGNAIGLAWESSSDKRFKKNIETVKDPVEKILGLRGVTFDWRNEEFPDRNFPTKKTYGFVAQEIEKIIPELVSTDSNGYKAVQYQNLTSVLVEAFKEAWAKIKDVANKLADLDDKTDKLAKENQKLEKRVKELEANHRALAEENKAIKELICADVDKKSKKSKICK